MRSITLNSIQELREILDVHNYGSFGYRGESDASWSLEPTIARHISRLSKIQFSHRPLLGREKLDWRERMREFERRLFLEYSQANHNGRELVEDDDLLAVLVNLQHYGAPTRLLDVTLSPYLALYFAISQGDSDFSFYTFHLDKLKKIEFCTKSLIDELFGELGAENPCLYFFRPKFLNERIRQQNGAFLVPSTLAVSCETIISVVESIGTKYVLPTKLRRDAHIMLTKMSISPKSVYPDEEGVIKSIAWEATARALT